MSDHRFGGRRRRGVLSRRTLVRDAPLLALAAGSLHRGLRQGESGMATPQVPVGDGYHEPDSTFFATAFVESSERVDTESEGDLWPCTWADDGQVYLLNGDGHGFDRTDLWSDIVMNRISGTPETGIVGERLAAGIAIAPIWGDPERYNRKPTGIVAVDGDGDGRDELYAAIQDLRHGDHAFDDAPTASIAVSRDYGRTWQSTDEPMFTDHVFTTIFFLDFGQSNASASVLGPDGADYVYAYGIDYNWRDSFSDTVQDPTDLYLARVPIDSIQDRATWAFFAGLEGDAPHWSPTIEDRVPVLTETRRVYPSMRGPGIHNMTVISQGSVVYNRPLDRYIYSSWTEYTFEFYEAPRPWGPWKLFLRKDFGAYPWFGGGDDGCLTPKNGGYATVIPSKFISDDGRTMWVQANWFVEVGCGSPNYNCSLRKLVIAPHVATEPENQPSASDNLAVVEGVVPIEKSTHFGQEDALNDGKTDRFDDSFDREEKTVDFWGYTWPRTHNLNRVVYTTGPINPDGGWFERDLRVQVRRDFAWHDVDGLSITPEYPLDDTTEPFTAYTLAFDETWGDGVRIIGTPGGRGRYTSISELEVYYAPDD